MEFVIVRHPKRGEARVTSEEVAFYRSLGFEPVDGSAVMAADPGGTAPANDPPSAVTGVEMRLDAILGELQGLRQDIAKTFVPADLEAIEVPELLVNFEPVVDELRGIRGDLVRLTGRATDEHPDGETVELRGAGDPPATPSTTTTKPPTTTPPTTSTTTTKPPKP